MDGYGDRSGYGSHGMPPGHGGMHNPAMRMRYSAMMGQERWPPPPHQYMAPTQHHQAMATGPINRFQVRIHILVLFYSILFLICNVNASLFL